MDKVYIIGHKNPDTDSICSAIAYENFKKQMGIHNCVPARLGKLNKETEFVLNYFNQAVPELVETVLPQISDVDYYKLNVLYPYMPIKDAWQIIKEKGIKLLTVIEGIKKKNLVGVISTGDIARFNMEVFGQSSLAKYKTTFYNVAQVLNAVVLYGENQLHDTIDGDITLCGNLNILKKINKNSILIVTESSYIEKIMKSDLKCVILGDACEVQNIPKTFKGLILKTTLSAIEIIKNIGLAVPVGEIMRTEDIVAFQESDFIDEIKDTLANMRYRHFPVMDDENSVLGTLSRRHLINIPRKKVILVDHNEKSQSVEGLEQAQVLEIIDHHRVADVQTSYPVFFRNEPVGSTATIIGNMFFQSNMLLDKTVAGLLLSAIISDTLLFKSPTCTELDRNTAQRLSEIAELDINEFGKKMLHAGAVLKDKTPQELLFNDLKEFSVNNYRFAVGQVNTASMEALDEIRSELMDYLKLICMERGYNLIALMVTDIINGGSEIIFSGDLSRVIKELFNSDKEETTGFLKGVVSRKKQVVPQLLNRLANY